MSATNMPAPSRIHIIGGSGTGKTTLGRQIGSMIGVEVFDLDAIGYEGAYEGQKGARRRSLEERLVDVRSISEKPGWVAERVFLWWVDSCLTTPTSSSGWTSPTGYGPGGLPNATFSGLLQGTTLRVGC